MTTRCTPENQLPPALFVWDKYLSKVGYATTDIIRFPEGFGYDPENTTLQPDVTVIGWCPANSIKIRNRSEGFVLMVEINGEEVWLHTHILP